jgi:hypothetical protein
MLSWQSFWFYNPQQTNEAANNQSKNNLHVTSEEVQGVNRVRISQSVPSTSTTMNTDSEEASMPEIDRQPVVEGARASVWDTDLF